MKKKIGNAGFILLLSVLLAGVTPVKSQSNLHLYVTSNSIPDASYSLDAIRKLTFEEGNLVGYFKDETPSISVPLDNLKFFSLKDFTSMSIDRKPSVDGNRIDIYYNPVVEHFALKSDKIIRSINLYNLQGRKLLQLHPKCRETTVPLASYPAGIYLIQALDERGTAIKKIIKN
jgi:hypothetical protein